MPDVKDDDYSFANIQIVSFVSAVLPIFSCKRRQFTAILIGLSNNTISILSVLQCAFSGKFCSELKNLLANETTFEHLWKLFFKVKRRSL